MRAVLTTAYGTPDVLQVGEVEKPVPRKNEILIKVHSASVTPGDCELRRFDMHVLFWLPVRLIMGITKPRRQVMGMELAGEIVEVGPEAKKFKPGDHVFAGAGLRLGAHAEYTCLPDTMAMAIKPEKVTWDEAATLPTGGLNALHYIRRGEIQPGQKVLINGAGGCFGTYAVQFAKYFGAEVTAVDSSDKLDVLRIIGADHVIDYKHEDFVQKGTIYDMIFDVVNKSSVTHNMKALKDGGRYVLANPHVPQVMQGMWSVMGNKKKFIIALAREDSKELEFLAQLMDEGKLKAVIDKRYPLEQMADAHRYVESGAKIGHVVIKVA